MIQKRQSAWNRKRLKNVIIAASVLLVLIVSVIVTSLVGIIGEEGDESTLPTVDTALGESLYAGRPIAYKTFETSQIQEVAVKYYEEDKDSSKQTQMFYSIKRPSKLEDFEFYYKDTNGIERVYRPEMFYKDGTSYTDFYANDGSTGYNVYKITYLLIAMSVLYFDEKMALPSDADERAKMLDRYGLSTDERQSVYISYIEGEGTLVEHTVHIGKKTIDGQGYYFTVTDNRDGKDVERAYIYSSLTTGFDYALNGFTSFLHSRLTAQGLPMDSSQEPYFTQEYKQWKNTLHNDPENKADKTVYGSKVIFNGSEEEYVYADYADIFGVDMNELDPGLYGFDGQFTLTLDSSASGKLRALLLNRPVGKLDSSVSTTIVGENNWAKLGADYTYTIKEIEAILTDDADIVAEGTPVGDARYIKVVYDYSISFVATSSNTIAYEEKDVKGVIDLQKIDTGIPEQINKMMKVLKGCSVGKLENQGLSADELELTRNVLLTYDENTADKYDLKYVITDIDVIYEIDDKGAIKSYGTEVKDSSVVNIRYALMHGSEIISSGKRTVDLGAIKEGEGVDSKIKAALIGKALGTNYSITAYTDTIHREYISDYRTYVIDAIDYFVTEEIICSFEFVNASERNPFYAESLFQNTLNNKNKIYALDSTASEYVVRVLGGISLTSDSSTSEGLQGTETVAVGLTAANMYKYGLYANTIYFELPRGIEGDKLVDGDYKFLDTLGFNLYISDMQPDGTRYIGSDMYDIIAKVDGSKFVFLDQSFVDYWARKSLAAVSYEDIGSMDFEFFMSDLKGSYTLDVTHTPVWIYGDQTLTAPPADGNGQEYDQIRLNVKSSNISEATDSLYKRMLLESDKDSLMLYSVYGRAMGVEGIPMFYRDTYGGMNFKSLLSIIFNTYFTGRFDSAEESGEQSQIIKKENLLMRMNFEIDSERFSDTYYYEFYSADDRRIMVRMYVHGESVNAVSDFYISPLAFKKIAGGFVCLLNGQTVVEDGGFTK